MVEQKEIQHLFVCLLEIVAVITDPLDSPLRFWLNEQPFESGARHIGVHRQVEEVCVPIANQSKLIRVGLGTRRKNR